MTTDPNIVPEEVLPDIEIVDPDDPPLKEDELPSEEDVEEANEEADAT